MQSYTRQVKDRGVVHAGALPEPDQKILSLARPHDERCQIREPWLRTYYGPGSDEAWKEITASPGLAGERTLLSDARRYDFGHDWRRVFCRLPQLLETAKDDYEAGVAAARERGHWCERADRADLESSGYVWPDDADYIGDLYTEYHQRASVDYICVLDEKTLGADDRQGIDADTGADDEESDEEWDRALVEEDQQRENIAKEESRVEMAKAPGQASVKSLTMAKLGQQLPPSRPRSCRERKILGAWYDAKGHAVRFNLLALEEITDTAGVIACGTYDDKPLWTLAEIGQEYDWETLSSPDWEDDPVGPDDLDWAC